MTMIIGIGTDLLSIKRIDRVLRSFPQKFPQKLLTPLEYHSFTESREPAAFLAKRFALKEAVLKSLGTGLTQGITWHDIEIRHLETGQPVGILKAQALKALQRRLPEGKIGHVHVSVSDEKDSVLAFVIISAVSEIPDK